MSIPALSSTTLSTAITASQTRIQVASSTGINGLGSLTSPQSIIVIGGEAMLVLNVPISGILEVHRGANGTEPMAYPNGATVYFGAKTKFFFAQDGAVGLAGDAGSQTATGAQSLPRYRLPLGSRKRDFLGNEYVFCDFTGTVYSGMPVAINADYTAAAPAVTGRGAIGVAAEPATSDQWGWVQIYGRCMAQVSYNGASPSDAANGPTTLQTSLQTKFILQTTQSTPIAFGYTSADVDGWHITGMWVAQDASPGAVSAVTSATSHVGAQIAVFLNYPQVNYRSVSNA